MTVPNNRMTNYKSSGMNVTGVQSLLFLYHVSSLIYIYRRIEGSKYSHSCLGGGGGEYGIF